MSKVGTIVAQNWRRSDFHPHLGSRQPCPSRKWTFDSKCLWWEAQKLKQIYFRWIFIIFGCRTSLIVNFFLRQFVDILSILREEPKKRLKLIQMLSIILPFIQIVTFPRKILYWRICNGCKETCESNLNIYPVD